VNEKRLETAAGLDKYLCKAEFSPHTNSAIKREALICDVSFHILNSEKEIDSSRPAWTISRTHRLQIDICISFTLPKLSACKRTICTETFTYTASKGEIRGQLWCGDIMVV
jgi:hypothetical protein